MPWSDTLDSLLIRATTIAGAVLVISATLGVALAHYGPHAVDDAPTVEVPEEPRVLVLYPTTTETLTTDPIAFDGNGRATFPPIDIPYTNVSVVSIRVEVAMKESLGTDRFSMMVVAPDGSFREAELEGPQSVSGYEYSDRPIPNWARRITPASSTYGTHDVNLALRWSAENHTDTESTGEWGASLSVTPPGTPLTPRDGTVRLVFQVTTYEALAIPEWAPRDGATPGGNITLEEPEQPTAADQDNATDPDNRSSPLAPTESATRGHAPQALREAPTALPRVEPLSAVRPSH